MSRSSTACARQLRTGDPYLQLRRERPRLARRGLDAHPAWSPSGKHIAFDTDRDGNRERYVMHVRSSVRKMTVALDNPFPAFTIGGARGDQFWGAESHSPHGDERTASRRDGR